MYVAAYFSLFFDYEQLVYVGIYFYDVIFFPFDIYPGIFIKPSLTVNCGK